MGVNLKPGVPTMFANIRYVVYFCPVESRYRLRKQTPGERRAALTNPEADQGLPKAVAIRRLQHAITTQRSIR